VQSALSKITGVSDLKIPDSEPDYTTFENQLIQYSGNAKPADVITILNTKTAFQVSIADAPEKKRQ
jgi:hypothetical protein